MIIYTVTVQAQNAILDMKIGLFHIKTYGWSLLFHIYTISDGSRIKKSNIFTEDAIKVHYIYIV